MTSPVNSDVAQSTQHLFEETMMVAVEQLEKILARIDHPTDKLCLSGGCMLNCPTNSRIATNTVFRNVFVEPACDDGGLPVGAALWAYHNLMGNLRAILDPLERGLPYLGLPLREHEIESTLESFSDHIEFSSPDNIPSLAANRISQGEVAGWFEGRSEVGPRALGHRSIVADPRQKETWHRVNEIKGREIWRPLAPSVLREHASEWFAGLPEDSPFMMFTADVIQDGVSAIAHVDNTARVQTVTKDCGGYYEMISRFYDITGCAVVLNTSMNGPGEPIAEFPEDAVKMLLDGRFDFLVLEDYLVERKVSG